MLVWLNGWDEIMRGNFPTPSTALDRVEPPPRLLPVLQLRLGGRLSWTMVEPWALPGHLALALRPHLLLTKRPPSKADVANWWNEWN
jgi:hypothetical protein